MNYGLSFSRRAANYFERLDRRTQERMRDALTELLRDPEGPPGKPLQGTSQRSLRVGGWRIIFFVSHTDEIVYVDAIAPRGEVYRGL